ncbi:MAG: NAD(P)/FAD-dependent oxidoreductase [archaeon]|nr:NAD(P)/FAD-dependent oxidoreductase [archaeon]
MRIGVVGAGISGLAISLGAEKAGHEVVLFESESDVGGRMSSVRFGPYIIDIGFHVLHTAYPSLHRWIDFSKLEFKEMEKCTESIDPDTGRINLLADAISMPLKLFPTLRATGLRDGLRLLRWRLASNSKDIESPLDFKSEKIMAGFKQRGFSNDIIQNILRPLFAGITLDPDLEERMSFASFTWAAMSLGSMIMLKGGIQAVPNQLVNKLISTQLLLNSKVDGVSSTTITCNKQTEKFDKVILATPQHVSFHLLNRKPLIKVKKTATIVFNSFKNPLSRHRLLINEKYGLNGNKILHAHSHPFHPQLVIATVIGKDADSLQDNQDEILSEFENWFGKQVSEWEFVAVTKVDNALPIIDTNHVGRVKEPISDQEILLAGDYTTHPSVQGALFSAERVLDHLGISIPDKTINATASQTELGPVA